MHCAILLILLLLFSPIFSLAKEISYPTNQIERPLTLPDGIWEVGEGIGYIQWDSSNTLYALIAPRYGITDNLELYLIGLRYRILNENAPVEVAIKGRIASFGYSSIDGTFVLTEVGVEGKQRIHHKFAFLYRFEDYYTYYSKPRDMADIRGYLGGVLSFTERLALEVTGTYRKLYGFDTQDARLFTTYLHYNISSTFDIMFEGEFSDFSKNEDSRYFSKSFKQTYGMRLNWRF